MSSDAAAQQASKNSPGKFYTFFVDGQEFRSDDGTLTGAQIMAKAGVTAQQGLVLVKGDGTEESVKDTDTFDLQPGRRFKIAPRFKRG